MLVVGSCVLLGALRGDLGDVNLDGAGALWNSWPALAAQVARLPSKRRGGTKRRCAPNITHTMVWRTCAPNVMETTMRFEHPDQAFKVVPTQGAPNVTLTVIL